MRICCTLRFNHKIARSKRIFSTPFLYSGKIRYDVDDVIGSEE